MLKYIYEFFRSRDSQPETPTLASSNQLEPEPTFSEDKATTCGEHSRTIPFQFTVKMPPPRYFPEILKRDGKGRIVTSKFPQLNL